MNILTKIYIGLTVLLITDLILYLTSGITLATKIADQILFWTWFILTFIVVIGQLKKKSVRVYGFLLLGLVFLSIIPMGFPIITVFTFMIPESNSEYLYTDQEIKIEITSKGVIGKPYVGVVKNYILFEKEIAELDFEFVSGDNVYTTDDIKSITRINKLEKKIITLEFDFGLEKIRKEIKTAHNNAYN